MKTAVEWLEQKLKANPFRIENDKLWNQAKAMEKEQIIDAYHINPLESKWENIGQQYYNETFKSE